MNHAEREVRSEMDGMGEIIFGLLLVGSIFVAARRSEKQDARRAAAKRRAARRRERDEWEKEMRQRIKAERMAMEYKAREESKKRKKPIRIVKGFYSGPDVEKFIFGEEETSCPQTMRS